MKRTNLTSKELQPLYAAVIAALKEVYDPEIPVNIYDLGLIYELTISKALGELLCFVPRGTFSQEVVTSVEISLKYAGYIEREKQQAEKNNRLEYIKIPADFDFSEIQGLTIECRQKLAKYKPETIAQASRISGVSPADISVLLVYFGR